MFKYIFVWKNWFCNKIFTKTFQRVPGFRKIHDVYAMNFLRWFARDLRTRFLLPRYLCIVIVLVKTFSKINYTKLISFGKISPFPSGARTMENIMVFFVIIVIFFSICTTHVARRNNQQRWCTPVITKSILDGLVVITEIGSVSSQ